MKMATRKYRNGNGETGTATADATSLLFQFADGKTLVVEFDKLPGVIMDAAARHGISQKVGDSFAGALTPKAAYDAAREMLASLMAGNWSAPRESTGGVLAEAVARVRKISPDAARETLAKLDADQTAAVRKHPAVKLALATIAAEKAAVRAKAAGDIPLPL